MVEKKGKANNRCQNYVNASNYNSIIIPNFINVVACLRLQIITGTYAEWLVSYNLLDCHFHTGFDDG
jgi:hypothetical protein